MLTMLHDEIAHLSESKCAVSTAATCPRSRNPIASHRQNRINPTQRMDSEENRT